MKISVTTAGVLLLCNTHYYTRAMWRAMVVNLPELFAKAWTLRRL